MPECFHPEIQLYRPDIKHNIILKNLKNYLEINCYLIKLISPECFHLEIQSNRLDIKLNDINKILEK